MSFRLLACLIALPLTACGEERPPAPASILLFNGTGVSAGDVAALRDLLTANNLDFATASSQQMDKLSAEQLAAYKLIIVPGGNFEVMGNHLSKDASLKIRTAVKGGVNYLGVCAGAFIAGNSPYNGFNLTDGKRFGFYAIENQGVRKAPVLISVAGASPEEHYWEDGPQLSGWGDAIARYPDSTPAIVEGRAGKGFMILSGVHPEAPESWRRGMAFSMPARKANAYAVTLIKAALAGDSLPHD